MKIVLLGKCNRKTLKKDRKKNRQNRDIVFTLTSHYQKFTSAGGSKYWFLAVDEAIHMKFSMFLKQKSDIKFIPFLNELQDTYGRHVHTFDVTMRERIEHLKMRVSTKN